MHDSLLSRRGFIAASASLLVWRGPSQRVPADAVEAVADESALHLKTEGRPVFDFRLRAEAPSANIRPSFLRAGYLHPVFTPAGRIVTDDYPDDHPHQHGIFFAWTRTEFEGRQPDFWNMGDGTGAVVLDKVEDVRGGPDRATFKARLRHVDLSAPQPKTALNEVWDVTVYRTVGDSIKGDSISAVPGRYTMFDIVSTQECASASPLILPDYRYGGIGIRGHRNWRVKTNVSFLTSEGKDRIAGDDTPARWCAMGGRVDGQLVGLATLGHPANFRAPQPLRIHPDDPYFNFSPSKRGQWEITPGKPYVSRYRFLSFDGEVNAAELNKLWDSYAKS
jgi:hypothetical protein